MSYLSVFADSLRSFILMNSQPHSVLKGLILIQKRIASVSFIWTICISLILVLVTLQINTTCFYYILNLYFHQGKVIQLRKSIEQELAFLKIQLYMHNHWKKTLKKKESPFEVPGWLSRLSVCFWLRS